MRAQRVGLRNDAISAQKCDDDPGDPGEDCGQRGACGGACGALRQIGDAVVRPVDTDEMWHWDPLD